MKKMMAIVNKNVYFKASFWSIAALILITAILSFLFPMGYMDIPLGAILGIFVSALFFLINGLVAEKEIRIRSAKITMVIFWLRILFLAGLMVLISVLYYHYNIHVFNIFSFIGGYLLSLVVFIVLVLKESKKE